MIAYKKHGSLIQHLVSHLPSPTNPDHTIRCKYPDLVAGSALCIKTLRFASSFPCRFSFFTDFIVIRPHSDSRYHGNVRLFQESRLDMRHCFAMLQVKIILMEECILSVSFLCLLSPRCQSVRYLRADSTFPSQVLLSIQILLPTILAFKCAYQAHFYPPTLQ